MSNSKKKAKATRKSSIRTTPVKLAMDVARAQKSYMEFGARERRHAAELEKARSGKAKAHKDWQAALEKIAAPPDLKKADMEEALEELAAETHAEAVVTSTIRVPGGEPDE